jgi:hypothetical protein
MKPACILLIVCGAVAAACGRDGADIAPLRLRHDPPIARLTTEQLKSLSIDCERYPPKESMRGRYDAKYCEDAIAAWGDSPLQMITIPGERPSPAHPPPSPQ